MISLTNCLQTGFALCVNACGFGVCGFWCGFRTDYYCAFLLIKTAFTTRNAVSFSGFRLKMAYKK
jgi:hypothetical protein